MKVWDHRQVNRDVYVVRCDGVERLLVSMTSVDRPSLTIRELVATMARLNGGTVAPESLALAS